MPLSTTEKWRRAGLLALGFLAIATAIRYFSSGGGPSEDFVSSEPPASQPPHLSGTLRAVSFNIYNRPWERAQRLQTALETLKELDPDIIALQEVATGWILPGDPAALFAKHLKMHLVRDWHEENLGVFKTGIAVLSRYPILSSEYHEFARHDVWDAKGYMSVRIAVPGGTLQMINLHMASTRNEATRRSEWQELASYARTLQHQGPVLIAGDFNTEPTDPALLDFVRETGVTSLYEGHGDLASMRSWTPDYRDSCGQASDPASALLDYFFVLPGTASGGQQISFRNGHVVIPSRKPHPSDHCPIVAEFHWRRP
jgi:endonuclease/exonuclease/phosphatase family metal-dependent hydrolase